MKAYKPCFSTRTIQLDFDWTTYDNINGSGGPFMLDIIGPAGPLSYVPGPNISLQAYKGIFGPPLK